MKKIELHCHLDGSMSLEVTRRLLTSLSKINPQLTCAFYRVEELADLPDRDLLKLLQAPMDCPSLADYLTRFDLPIFLLQTKEGLEAAAYDLLRQAALDDISYIEIRFAPFFHQKQGLSIREVIESVLAGMARGLQDFGVYSGLLVCGMRGMPMEENLRLLEETAPLFIPQEERKGLEPAVVGADLAGDEKAYPTILYKAFFEKARALSMPFTIHAGECGNPQNIADAIALGARRIGHGIAMAEDRDLRRICARDHIGVELCPTSNLQTKAVSDFASYPYGLFREEGIPLSINTDNRMVSGTGVREEWQRLSQRFPITQEEERRLYQDGIDTCFASEEIKQCLTQIK